LAVPGTQEGNPLPGMGSTLGRVGWGIAEALLAAGLLKAKPSVGRAYVTGSNISHNALVGHNMKLKDAYSRQ